jgi:hypothetical protein
VPCPTRRLAALDAIARLARRTGPVVHVVLPREPGVVEHARAVAQQATAVEMSADLMVCCIRVRFSGLGR